MAAMGWTQSENYRWKKSNSLGKGATAVVYQGNHKVTGDPVAVKCFNKPDYRGIKRHDQQMLKNMEAKQMKELELLKQLDHKNIIKLICTEREEVTRDRVAIMELCEGGSLLTVLHSPENTYGINEEEFLLLLKDSTAGLKYLRDRNVSHRDIKPGNILLYITEEGRHVFKLADFDTARVLSDDQPFQTICGTEEYLCPYIFAKGLMEDLETAKRDFSPMADLWSLGCTFYHAATGSLPFQPCKTGGNQRKGMYKIHQTKVPGVIAAIENEQGEVEWRTDLPDTCLLSSGLQNILVCLLQKLLTKEVGLSFKDYFDEMDKIFSKNRIHVFDVHKCKAHTFYLDPDALLGNLRIQIRNQTCMKVEEQILIQNGVFLDKLESSSLVSNVIRETSPTDPVFLLPSSQMDFTFTLEQIGHLNVQFPKFPANGGIRSDAYIAEQCTSNAYVIARHVESLAQCFNCLLKISTAITSMIVQEVDKLSELLGKSTERLCMLECILNSQDKQTLSVSEFVPLLGLSQHMDTLSVLSIVKQRKSELVSIRHLLSDMQDGIISLQERYGAGKKNPDSWMTLDVQITQMLTRCKDRAYNYVKAVRSSWKALDSFWRNPSDCALEDCGLEKTRVKRTCGNLLSLHEDCSSALQNVIKALQPSFSEFLQDLQTCNKLKLRLNCGIREIKNFEALLKNTEDNCERMFCDVISKAKELKLTDTFKNRKSKNISLQEGLEEIKESQQGMRTALEENTSLTEKFLRFSEQLCQRSDVSQTVE